MPIFPKGTKLSFKPLPSSQINESHRCLLNNIWNAKGNSKKILAVLNALMFYFLKIQNKPLGRNFSLYVVFKGLRPGIYHIWPKVLPQIKYFYMPHWQGFFF